MKLISFFFLITLSLFYSFSNSQTFEILMGTEKDEIALDAIALNDSLYVVLSQRGDFDLNDYTEVILYTLDNKGIFSDSLIIKMDSLYPMCRMQKIFIDTNQNLILAGRVEHILNSTSRLYFAKVDTNLNLLFDTILGEIDHSDIIFNYILNSKNNLVTVGYTVYDSLHKTFVTEHNLAGELVQEIEFEWNAYAATSIIELVEKSAYQIIPLFSITGGILEVNSENLEFTDTFYYSPSYHGFDTKRIPGTEEYIITGWKHNYIKWQLYLTKLDFDGGLIYEHLYGIEDTNCWYSINCLDITNENIFLAGTHNFPNSPPFFQPEPRWIFANKLGLDGSIVWQRFYKGELSYMPYKILATNDGGALILSTKYDWNNPIPNQRDIHILKVDSTGWYKGLTTGTTEFGKPKQILVYPNPIKNQVNFVLGHYTNLELFIYNSNGTLVKSETLENSEILDLSFLPTGLYVYILKNKKGFVEKGKLIKE